MRSQTQKLSQQLLALALAVIMLIGVLPVSAYAATPSTVETNLDKQEIFVGEPVEFTVTTIPNDDAGTMVLGYFDFNNGDWSVVDTIQYKSGDNWLDLPHGSPFGPPVTGFPMADATSTFRVTFNAAGTFDFSISMQTAEDNRELCALDGQVTVSVKPSEITTNIDTITFITGKATEFSFTSIPNGHAGEMVFGKFTFSDWSAVSSLEYWGVTEGTWLPLPKDVLFGPAGTGFPMTEATTKLRVTFNKIGNYSCTVSLVKASDPSIALSTVTKTVTVKEASAPVLGDLVAPAGKWVQSVKVSGTVTDEGGSGVAKVVYGTSDIYDNATSTANLTSNTSFEFIVTKNDTYYVWAVDGHNNVSEAKHIVITNIDTESPSFTVEASTKEWTNSPVTLSVSVSDDAGAPIDVWYATDETFTAATKIQLKDGKGSITVNENATYYFKATDAAGNESEIISIEVKNIDTGLPSIDNISYSSDLTKDNVTISFTAVDELSGIAAVLYSTDKNFSEGETEKLTFNEENGHYAFTASENGTYYLRAVDRAGNFTVKSVTISTIDRDGPTINYIYSIPTGATNQSIVVRGKVTSVGSEVAEVRYNTEGADPENYSKAEFNEATGTFTFTVESEYKGLYYIWAVDALGNSSLPRTVNIFIDKTAPVVDKDSIAAHTDVNEDPVDSGTPTKEGLIISGKVSDPLSGETASGVVKVVYSTENTYSNKHDEADFNQEDGTFTFTVSNENDFNSTYYIWAVDAAGNVSNFSEEASFNVFIDTTVPVVDSVAAHTDVNEDSVEIPSGTPTKEGLIISGKVSDPLSGETASGVVKVVYSTEEDYSDKHPATDFKQEDGTFTFTVSNNEEFHGNYYIWAIDAAGNISDPMTFNVFIDTTDPMGFKIDINKIVFEELLDTLTFSLFKSTDLQVTIETWDSLSPSATEDDKKENLVSGVQQTEYFISASVVENPEDIEDWIVYEDPFSITQEQEFIIYIRVTDKAGNVFYASSDGFVLDKTDPIIVLTYDNNDSVNSVGDSAYFDSYRTATIAISEHYTNQADSFVPPNVYVNTPVKENDTNYIRITAVNAKGDVPFEPEIEWKLIDSFYAAQIVFNADAAYTLDFSITDKAGNTSTNEDIATTASSPLAFTVDTTNPVISVSYDNNAADSNTFYKADRTATITITDQNFDPNNVTINVKNDDGTIPALPAPNDWVDVSTAEDPAPIYAATIRYSADGDYTFTISSTDIAKNTTGTFNNGMEKDAFTIDKTVPAVVVTYNNNSAQNEKYFKDPRTATVTITEHNFNIDRVTFTITTARGGAVPEPVWSHEGNVHTAVLSFTVDGDYTFDVQVRDKAGNSNSTVDYSSCVAANDFILDQTFADMITVTGVENHTAYGYDATLIPEITVNDINLWDCTVTLTGVQKGVSIDLTEQVTALLKTETETITGVFDVFALAQDLDGIYTLTIVGRDLAGNEIESVTVFTVNRYGSVYSYNDYLLGMIANGGAYVNNVTDDLVITEFNADKLLAGSLSIEITCDGKPLENVIYTANPALEDDYSYGESGWYQYCYTISKENFVSDGVYKLSVSSVDATGNTPQNSNYEDMGIRFMVDSTAPEITNISGLEEEIINASEVIVTYKLYDGIGLNSVKIYVDGVQVGSTITDFGDNLNSYTGTFTLTEKSAAQRVRIEVTDLAGNVTDTDAETFTSVYTFHKEVTVSTNIFVRWYANTPLFWGSIGGVAILAAVIAFIASKRKKKTAV